MFQKLLLTTLLYTSTVCFATTEPIQLKFLPEKLDTVMLYPNPKSSALKQWQATGCTHVLLITPYGSFTILQSYSSDTYPRYTDLPTQVPEQYRKTIDELLAKSPLLVAALCRKAILSVQLTKAERQLRHERQKESELSE